jgi:hypothetical protein
MTYIFDEALILKIQKFFFLIVQVISMKNSHKCQMKSYKKYDLIYGVLLLTKVTMFQRDIVFVVNLHIHVHVIITGARGTKLPPPVFNFLLTCLFSITFRYYVISFSLI